MDSPDVIAASSPRATSGVGPKGKTVRGCFVRLAGNAPVRMR